MPSRDRGKAKGRSDKRVSYAGVPREVMETRKYSELSGWGAKLLLDLAYQFRGANNGDLQCAWSVMSRRGWKSKGTLDRALRELLACGFIEQTRQGGKHRCSLYALTWREIHEVLDSKTKLHKLDVPPTRTQSRTWRD